MTAMIESGPISEAVFRCRVCGNADSHQAFRIREMMFGTRKEFDYFMCGSCGCLQIADIPTELSHHYPNGYYSHEPLPAVRRAGAVRRNLERLQINNALFQRGFKLSRLAKQFVPLPVAFFRARPELLVRAGVRNFQTAILDIGCGSQAQWLRDLRAIGFRNLLGLDPFVEADLQVDGIPIRRTDASTFAAKSRRRFDLITLHHSFEHIPEQLETLRAVRRLLSPGGTCVIRIPTVSSRAWNMYGINWVELDAPRHLYIHSKDSLRGLANKAGLELIDIQYDTTAFEFYGSEQYLLDIPLTAPDSLWVNAASTLFSAERLREFETMAEQVNADGSAGRAAFFFTRSQPR
jgi:SAM-dependent methyltransferase